jgi:hypothetical protein
MVIAESSAEFNVRIAWHEWYPKHDKKLMNGFLFYCYLQRHRPELLNFECRCDRWQYVHCWLRRAGLVNG